MRNDWIVVVDDDAVSLQNAQNLLCENYTRVSTAHSGEEFLKFMESNSPDLILLDILMPGMDGFETYHLLRDYEAKTGRRETPVIFLTGENDSAAERRGLTMGASDFIRKPFNRDILLRRIHNTIQNSKTIESLTEEATLDKLTGFLNKAGATAKMTLLCQVETGILVIFDLDSFKLVNDLYGHDMGDRVLATFAGLVRRNTRADDVLCRIGGDEFLAFCRNATDESAVAALTKRLNEQLTAECRLLMGEDFGIPIGVSVGAVSVPQHGRDYQQLFPLADKALYQVKQNGKHGYAVYNEALSEGVPEAETLDQELARMTRIMEERNESNSAMWLGQDDFTTIFRYVSRYLRYTGETAVKLMFLVSVKDSESGDSLLEAADAFGDVLGDVLSIRDVVLKSRPTQSLVLLPGQESGEEIVMRIMAAWMHSSFHDRFTIAYVMEDMHCKSEKKAESEQEKRLRSIPGIDYDTGIEYCGSPDSYGKLLDVFRQSIAQESAAIEEYWRGGDIKAYTVKVHALKSSARTIGASELSERAKAMEAAGNAGDTAAIDANTPGLLELYRSFAEKLAPVFESGGEDALPLAGSDELEPVYEALVECAGMMDYDMAEMALESLKGFRLPSEDMKRVEDIRSALLELDWERVAALCKR